MYACAACRTRRAAANCGASKLQAAFTLEHTDILLPLLTVVVTDVVAIVRREFTVQNKRVQ